MFFHSNIDGEYIKDEMGLVVNMWKENVFITATEQVMGQDVKQDQFMITPSMIFNNSITYVIGKFCALLSGVCGFLLIFQGRVHLA